MVTTQNACNRYHGNQQNFLGIFQSGCHLFYVIEGESGCI